jgi:hypothetical protein
LNDFSKINPIELIEAKMKDIIFFADNKIFVWYNWEFSLISYFKWKKCFEIAKTFNFLGLKWEVPTESECIKLLTQKDSLLLSRTYWTSTEHDYDKHYAIGICGFDIGKYESATFFKTTKLPVLLVARGK